MTRAAGRPGTALADASVGMVYPSHGHGATRKRATEYGHPAHRGFADAVGADPVVVEYRQPPGPLRDTLAADAYAAVAADYPARDVYVTENDAVLYAAPVLKRRHPDATVVHLAASDRLLGSLCARRPDRSRLWTAKRCANSRADHAVLRRLLRRHCDGAVAVSTYARDRVRSFAPDLPVRVATPYVQPDVAATLAGVDPDLDANVAVAVGAWRDHKGFDRLVAAWPRVRERHPDAELRLVGPGHPGAYADVLGVTVRGFVPDLAAELSGAALYVHPARIEAFGVSVVEAMQAGVPAVVTETTGARSAVEAVDGSLVVPPTPRALADAVADYFDADADRRRALSAASRDASGSYTADVRVPEFRRALAAVVAAGDA